MRADVYSFGVLVWETMARRQPWKELNGFQIINQVGMGAVQRLNVVDTSRVKLRLVW